MTAAGAIETAGSGFLPDMTTGVFGKTVGSFLLIIVKAAIIKLLFQLLAPWKIKRL